MIEITESDVFMLTLETLTVAQENMFIIYVFCLDLLLLFLFYGSFLWIYNYGRLRDKEVAEYKKRMAGGDPIKKTVCFFSKKKVSGSAKTGVKTGK